MQTLQSTSRLSGRLSVLGAASLGALLCLGSVSCRGWTSDSPPVHLNPNMDTQEKLKPYRASAFFKDGRAMRPQVEGTIARGELEADAHRFQGKLPNGKFAGTFPKGFAADTDDVMRGQERYNIYCTPCHGQSGDGMGPVARRLLIKPPTFHQERIQTLAVGEIFNVISHGKNLPNMPSYGAQIQVDDRWRIALYVRALQRTRNPNLPITTVEPAAAPAPGADGTEGGADGEAGADGATGEDAAGADGKTAGELPRQLPQGLSADQLREHVKELEAEKAKKK